MKKCPDLTKLSFEEKKEYWSSQDPRQLKDLGDRLLAESLPHNESSSPREEIAKSLAQVRTQSGLTVEELSEVLGVTEDVYLAWEEDRVKAPESLPLVVKRLHELADSEE